MNNIIQLYIILRRSGFIEGHWSRGMISALGADGREFDSRMPPILIFLVDNMMTNDFLVIIYLV